MSVSFYVLTKGGFGNLHVSAVASSGDWFCEMDKKPYRVNLPCKCCQ